MASIPTGNNDDPWRPDCRPFGAEFSYTSSVSLEHFTEPVVICGIAQAKAVQSAFEKAVEEGISYEGTLEGVVHVFDRSDLLSILKTSGALNECPLCRTPFPNFDAIQDQPVTFPALQLVEIHTQLIQAAVTEAVYLANPNEYPFPLPVSQLDKIYREREELRTSVDKYRRISFSKSRVIIHLDLYNLMPADTSMIYKLSMWYLESKAIHMCTLACIFAIFSLGALKLSWFTLQVTGRVFTHLIQLIPPRAY